MRRYWTAAILLGALLATAERGLAQAPPAMTMADRLAALVGMPTTVDAPTTARRPLARLVHNPDTATGQPPYALADQGGAIQRLVETVPGIDLEPYVGTVVTVRYDTGRTLLASQLDLPAPPAGSAMVAGWPGGPASGVRLAQHVEPLAGDDAQAADPPRDEPLDANGDEPSWTTSAPHGGVEPIYLDSMSPGMMGAPSSLEMAPGMMPGMGPCPTCGGTCDAFGSSSMVGDAGGCASCAQDDPWRLYADLDLNVFRVRVAEDPTGVGQLSEHYDLSPRVVVGTENPWLDARVRYWRYHETTPVLGGGNVRFEFDVLDVEATTRLQGRRSDVTLAGGIRLADLDLNINVPRQQRLLATGSDLIGLTLAADAQTRIFSGQLGQWGVVYGGRLSLLGGDWGGGFSRADDNVVVHELYGGVEYLYSFRAFDLHARVTAEWQNWHSDALAANGLYESIGFFGPSAQIGVDF